MTEERLHLTLVRHGATDWNGAGRWQGWSDTPLGAVGAEQAARLRSRLTGRAFDRAFSSDLARAARTAELSLPAGTPLTLDVRLRELHFGVFEGVTTDEVLHDAGYAQWQLDPWGSPAPGGESLAQVGARLRDWAEEVPGGRVIAFTHGAAIRALLCDLFGWPADPQPGYVLPFPYQLSHTSLTTLTRAGRGPGARWALVTYNDHAHLEEPVGG
ncbi:histidine phosphatase family protein [Deinococcus radiotolerans]|uniref:Phosphoglycerate mutase n=1 Tax=Deinococcus radiotolerans TaxID=1309407 RepID=A0ABQ2FM87_9DEIO|nr:histidine phosphatase family protein [Deinococcus radiotolerans]GGL06912.1 phosphoglycerate mutase [Deinococcus radiotolerans]